MPLTQDELREVFKNYIRLSTDLSQGMTYILNSKYNQGIDNWIEATDTLHEILRKVRS